MIDDGETKMHKSLNLADFLAGPGGKIARQLGLPADLLASCASWDELTSLAVSHNDHTDGGLWHAGERLDGVLSTGERAVLHALLAALDFSRLADQLAGEPGTWRLLDFTHGTHAEAVAACILRRNA